MNRSLCHFLSVIFSTFVNSMKSGSCLVIEKPGLYALKFDDKKLMILLCPDISSVFNTITISFYLYHPHVIERDSEKSGLGWLSTPRCFKACEFHFYGTVQNGKYLTYRAVKIMEIELSENKIPWNAQSSLQINARPDSWV